MNPYFASRCTVRSFDTSRQLSKSYLTSLLEAAAQAPTTGGIQLYSVVLTTDHDIKATLGPAHFNQPAFVNAPVVLTFCADVRRYTMWCEANNADAGFDNLQSLTAAVLDATIFAQQFVTIAEMEGLGTCYLGTTTYNAEAIAEALHLPQLVVPVITVAVGWPSERPAPTHRLTTTAYVHDETFHDYTPATIQKEFAEKEGLAESKHFVEENGVENLAQVFARVRYPRANNEHFSATFRDFLLKQGFTL